MIEPPVEFEASGQRIGIVGYAVGAPYAVLVAEQMFTSGCELLVSVTSSGQLEPPLVDTLFRIGGAGAAR